MKRGAKPRKEGLSPRYAVAICHPRSAEALEDAADLIVFRNAGSVMGYQAVYDAFVDRVTRKGLRTFNTFTGKADMRGKQYLLDLTRAGYPVIPTVDACGDLDALPRSASMSSSRRTAPIRSVSRS